MKPPLLRHGGAGNRATVTSDYLTLQQAQDLIAAAQCALLIGKPLTRHLTVRLERQGIPDVDAMKAIGRLITLLRDDVRKTTDGEIAYICANENVRRLSDLLLRRTAITMEGLLTPEAIQETAKVAADFLGWNKTRKKDEIEHAEAELAKRSVKNVRPA